MRAEARAHWMGTSEAADYIGISFRLMYALANDGKVPAYRRGRVLRIRRSDLDAYLETVRVQPGELEHLTPNSTVRKGTRQPRR